LRNIYNEEMQTTSAGGKAETDVTFSLKDPNSGEDSVPMFSDVQTPLSQNAIVQGIIDDLRRKHTRVVYIVATNVLDAIFLARVVRKYAPDAWILNRNPDVLFVSAASDSDLSGALFLSTYPMFFQGDEWLSGKQVQRRVMYPTPQSQGVHTAIQAVLADINAPSQSTSSLSPGMWLLTLNRSGFLPVDLFDPPTRKLDTWYSVKALAPERSSAWILPEPPRAWFLTTGLVTVFTLWACFVVLRINRSLLIVFYRLRRHYLPLTKAIGAGTTHLTHGSHRHISHRPSFLWLSLESVRFLTSGRLVTLSAAALSLSAIEWILFLPVVRASFALWWWLTMLAGVVGFTAPFGVMACLWARKRSRRIEFQSVFYLAIVVLLFLVVIAAWTYSCFAPGPASLFFCYRALELYSGSSPALPLILVSFLFFVGSLFYLKRFTRAGLGRPRLSLGALKRMGPLKERYRTINSHVSAPMLLAIANWQTRIVLCTVFVLLCQFNPWGLRYLAAMENESYNRALVFAISLVVVALTLMLYDMVIITRNLVSLLDLLAFLPLRTAFDHISRHWPRRPIWASARRLSRISVAKRMVSALHNRRLILRQREDDLQRLWKAVPERSSVLKSRICLKKIRKYEGLCASLATEIVLQDLGPTWRAHPIEHDTESAESNSEKRDLALRASCSDFVALQFSRFLMYVVRQVTAMAWCVSFALVMLMLTLNCYSPQAPMILARFLALISAIAGVVVFRVFAGMERNGILSRIAGTEPGELNREFWFQVIAMGVLPFVGLMLHLFPSLSSFVSSWVTPSVEAIH
jgi:hypothetical protein